MFWGLMSRWTTPWGWAASSPWHICLAMRRPTPSGSAPLLRIRSLRVTPSRYSIEM